MTSPFAEEFTVTVASVIAANDLTSPLSWSPSTGS